MISRKSALKLNVVVLCLASVMDIIRGIAHTFRVRFAATELAGIEPISDSLVLMCAFGMSNFLTGFIYFLIAWKSKDLAPYILVLISTAYFIGSLGMKFQDVELESKFTGQHILPVYFLICVITAILYFVSKKRTAED